MNSSNIWQNRKEAEYQSCKQKHAYENERGVPEVQNVGWKRKRSGHEWLRGFCLWLRNVPWSQFVISHISSDLTLWLKKSRTHCTLWLEVIAEISERGCWESAKLNIISKTLGRLAAELGQGSPGLGISHPTNCWFPCNYHKALLGAMCKRQIASFMIGQRHEPTGTISPFYKRRLPEVSAQHRQIYIYLCKLCT